MMDFMVTNITQLKDLKNLKNKVNGADLSKEKGGQFFLFLL